MKQWLQYSLLWAVTLMLLPLAGEAQVIIPGPGITPTPVPGPGPTPAPVPDLIDPQPHALGRFKTWKTQPGYHKPAYPIVFVASYRDATLGNSGNFGTDVLQVGIPQGGQELWILLTNGKAKKLFPIQGVHEGIVDESLSPINGRILGAVTEPSISIDGTRVYFTYFHNATDLPPGCCGSVGHSNFEGWPLGGDLYMIDLSDLLANVNFNPANLPPARLTETAAANQLDHAMDQSLAQITGPFPAGVVYTGAIEIDGPYGRQLLFASTRKFLGNSNIRMSRGNKNYNLFTADIGGDTPDTYALSNIKQAQYYTTSSAISPNRLRVGYAFSYQANVEEARQWHIQQVIGHKWTPLYGYGIGNELAHLATFCVKNQGSTQLPVGDYTLATRYYNQNNNAFGAVFAQPMDKAGLNIYHASVTNGKVPQQVGSVKITSNVITGDNPSNNGKFTTPACGGPDELYMAYDPGDANHKNNAYNYQPKVVFTDLEPADPVTAPAAYEDVIVGTNTTWAALWPKPVIDWSQRLTGVPDREGDATQQPPPSPITAGLPQPLGAPTARLGTSSLYNTDVTPVDCRANTGYYDPNIVGDAKVDPLYNNIAMLTRLMAQGPGDVQNQTGSCAPPMMRDVFGVAVYLTSNRSNEDTFVASKRGYTTGRAANNSGVKESKRLLGVFKTGMHGQTDASFKALIPSNVPVDFHLLDASGVKLADVRSWHSLKAREERVDCGGCHNHREGAHELWSNSDSASNAIVDEDMVLDTSYIEYNINCRPTLTSNGNPVEDVPVWQDISAGFDSNCGSCHEQGSGNTNAKNAFDYDATKLHEFDGSGIPVAGNPLVSLFARKYIDRYSANGSPMFWAAYGGRTDGRSNTMLEYQPDQMDFSTCSDGDPSKCGYVYTASHDNLATCNGTDLNAAKWVYQLSQWIDNHAPVNVPNEVHNYDADRYHPTAEAALVPDAGDCGVTPLSLDLGFWDDSGGLDTLDVNLNGQDYFEVTDNNQLLNGMIYSVPLLGTDISGITDSLLEVIAIDTTGNRQLYEKTVDELIQECEATL